MTSVLRTETLRIKTENLKTFPITTREGRRIGEPKMFEPENLEAILKPDKVRYTVV